MRGSLWFLGLLSAAWLPSIVWSPIAMGQVDPSAFVNYEIAPIHGMDLSPGGVYLATVNTADMRVEVYSLASGAPVPHASIAVGLEPVSVRFRTDQELWVVNNLSDSVSVLDVAEQKVIATLRTLDDPYDVVFAGSSQRAFVSCGLPSAVQIFEPDNLSAAPTALFLQGNNPRALAVSPDGLTVHAAFFHSGNRTTILSGGMSHPNSTIISFPPDSVTNTGPHSGANPPPNSGSSFSPPRNIAAGTPPKVSLIVRQDSQGNWRDDTGANWTNWISGSNANQSGRYPGWTLLDHDLAIVDADTLQVGYVGDLMNLCMALDANPVTGHVAVVGTEAHNEIRFEPNLNAKFIDVVAAFANPTSLQPLGRADLNSDLIAQFAGAPLSAELRASAVGDPRSIKWTSDGLVAYVAGMGSNNVTVIDHTGQRIGDVIQVQEGPVGLAIDESRGQLYVLNRFDGSISVVDMELGVQTSLVTYFDPTPSVIRTGRKHLYDTRHSSGIGQVSCASCHVDGRMDRLSWDLGNPAGNNILLTSRDLNRSTQSPIPIGFLGNQVIGTGSLTNFHPMKGPMLTQTLQDIIGHEPLHWRGDRFGIEEFNGTFHELQGRSTGLTTSEMAEFKAFLATIHFPPNPFRNVDNTLPTNLPLQGHYATGRFSLPAGSPLPNGNAVEGLNQYRVKTIGSAMDRGVFACVTCHTLPSGGSTDRRWRSTPSPASWKTIPLGQDSSNHLMVMGASDVGSFVNPIQNTTKVPQLRNLHERVGFHMRPGTPSLHGFGHMHDGNVASLADFIGNPAFIFTSDQQIANMVALMLAWSGSDFRESNGSLIANDGSVAMEPPGVFSKDSHAGVGQQETITHPSQSLTRLNQLVSAVNSSPRIQLIAKSYGPGGNRGYLAVGGNFIADYPGEQITLSALVSATGNGNSVTFTLVPSGTGHRLALDRDMDGYLDYEEQLNCTDPNDPNSFGTGGCATVQASFVYHNAWTGQGSAIDSVKIVHQEGETPTSLTYDNLVNSTSGILGLGFDIQQLADPDQLSATDFELRMSPQGAFVESANRPENWALAPAPASVAVTEGEVDRVIISWNGNSITNRWLRVTIKANTNTGLTEDEVFYVGHLLGETTGESGGNLTVAFADIAAIRNAVGSNVDAGSSLDIDKNGIVAFADIAAMRGNIGTQLTMISVPAAPE